ncbi:MAG: UDP-N-acetylglucosamine 2-epimerase [Methylococcales bacterium]|nr:UDP-N-acetylglucosamine 2-epimerase [Methylococcales bacterium]
MQNTTSSGYPTKSGRAKFSSLFDDQEKVLLVTGHRRESFGEGFKQICRAISRIAETNPLLSIVYPVHLNPNVRTIVYKELSSFENIRLIDPLPYDEMVFLMGRSWLILTDSGGIQEEAPSLNVPLIVMRDVTERQEGIDSGCAVLAGVSADNIYAKFLEITGSKDLYCRMANVANPYGDGEAGIKIVEILERCL